MEYIIRIKIFNNIQRHIIINDLLPIINFLAVRSNNIKFLKMSLTVNFCTEYSLLIELHFLIYLKFCIHRAKRKLCAFTLTFHLAVPYTIRSPNKCNK